ncbi:MAG: thiamine pyrophosphate-dependent dehydrogenase E1 component subunit alpha [Actinomycetota bacterium]|nr:MAG: thiamine pyrophosphate-dependent dehydrogenase E1 component subunit alpha [Actinomycetota bacterium]
MPPQRFEPESAKKVLPDLEKTGLIELLHKMLLVRRFEERLIRLAEEGPSFGHYHVYIGQETIGIPALAALRPTDLVFPTHRNHGYLLSRGADPGRLMAEILGKQTGLNGGKAGTLHASAPELGIPHTSAIVGGIVPIAAGAALAAQLKGSNQISVALFGDGATEEGATFEALNIASLWRVPVIFLCENNTEEALGAAAGGYPKSVTAATDLGSIARSVGVPAVVVDGTDTRAVFTAMSEAAERARTSGGPTFVEAKVVRWPGSNPLWPELPAGETELRFAWEPESAPEQLLRWYRDQDGLLRYLREMLGASLLDKDDAAEIDSDVRSQVEAAVRFARNSAYPTPDSAYLDVFAGQS